jgi:hypothetical protein
LLLRRLRETKLYHRALIVVTADHGVSFLDERRLPTPTNLHDIAFVPLFVKLPNQRQGRVVDSFARTIDVVPTIARVLRVPLPWHLDGRPLVGAPLPPDGTVTVSKSSGSVVSERLSTLRARRGKALRRQTAWFGTGSFSLVYRVGPHRELLGRSVDRLPVRAGSGVKVRIDGRPFLDTVERTSAYLPSFVEGRLLGGSGRIALAVAVNGRIAAVTYSFTQADKRRFSALVLEEALRDGANTIDVFAVRGTGRTLRLERLEGSDLSFTLKNGSIESSLRTIAIKPGVLVGHVRTTQSEKGYVFRGSVFDPRINDKVDVIVVFAGGKAVYVTAPETVNPQSLLGQRALGRFGFEFELPRALLPVPPEGDVHLFAIRGRVASELRYVGDYPWRRG